MLLSMIQIGILPWINKLKIDFIEPDRQKLFIFIGLLVKILLKKIYSRNLYKKESWVV